MLWNIHVMEYQQKIIMRAIAIYIDKVGEFHRVESKRRGKQSHKMYEYMFMQFRNNTN